MNTILWTYQRTGATSYRHKHNIGPALFGEKGEYGGATKEQVSEVAPLLSFKVSVGAPMNWGTVINIIEFTPNHRNILMYRENSTDRVLSWWVGSQTGANNPAKIEENVESLESLLEKDELPIETLVEREMHDLSRLSAVKAMLKTYEVISYEHEYENSSGYGTKEYYQSFSQYQELKDILETNEDIISLKNNLSVYT